MTAVDRLLNNACNLSWFENLISETCAHFKATVAEEFANISRFLDELWPDVFVRVLVRILVRILVICLAKNLEICLGNFSHDLARRYYKISGKILKI